MSESNAPENGGGNQSPPPIPPEAGGQGNNSPDIGKLLSAIEGITTRLTGLESRVAAPAEKPAAQPASGPAPGPDPKFAKQLSDAQKAAQAAAEAQAKALSLAKAALVRSHLNDVKNPEYLRLVPAVELDDNGNLTKASAEALDKFKEQNPDLFKQTTTGWSPMPGGKGSTSYSQDEMRSFANAGISPGSWKESLKGNPALIASIEAARQRRN